MELTAIRGQGALGRQQAVVNLIDDDENKQSDERVDQLAQQLDTLLKQYHAGQVQFSQFHYTVAEDVGEFEITVERTQGQEGEVSVDYLVWDPEIDDIIQQGILSWPSGVMGAQRVALTIIDDKARTGNKQLLLLLHSPITGQRVDMALLTLIDNEPLLPSLGNGIALNTLARSVQTDTNFAGGIASTDEHYEIERIVLLAQPVTIRGEIEVDSQHIGQLADIIVVGAYQTLDEQGSEQFYLMNQQGEIKPWDTELATLEAFQAGVRLAAHQPVSLYEGTLSAKGDLKLYFGYRLVKEATLVFNGRTAIRAVIR